MSDRTFKVDNPPLRGSDVEAWQEFLNKQMRLWDVEYRIPEDGEYGAITRSLTASVCHGLGLESASEAMKNGVTPELRVKLRNKNLTPEEVKRHQLREKDWLPRFRDRHNDADVSPPLARILQSSWGYQSGHDGVDLICKARAAGLAICKARVLRADNSGWWGKGAPSPAIAAKGDGVVVIECLVNVGPFKKGLCFVYGHAEHVRVKAGDIVEAGQVICEAGLANAWHFHFCVNRTGKARPAIGDHDPMPYVRYAQKHG
jgi:murein DD-endopeptidase MepM/ murein hydrolase activator NlpD